ncbi:MAG TPA: patatin family protein [Pseudonocardia sp.]|nr:patatin family protein [Pseudonocardia sp.]
MLAHPVLDVLRMRRKDGTGPDTRLDGHRVVLVVEGGGSRATYSSGMVLAVEELGLTRCFDAVYGTSAGSLSGSWLIAGQAATCCAGWWRPGLMERVTDVGRGLRGRPVIDVEYLINRAADEQDIPLDWQAIVDSDIPLHPVATDVENGASVDLHPTIVDKASLQMALRASANVPLLAGLPIEIDGRRFVDGAVSEPLPFHTALSDGATHLLVLRTRRADQEAIESTRIEKALVSRLGASRVPGLVRVLGTHMGRRRADDELLARKTANPDDKGPHLFEVRPPEGADTVSPLETDPERLERAVMVGREAFLSTWESRELHAESLTGAEPPTGIEPSADAEAAPSEEPQVAEA